MTNPQQPVNDPNGTNAPSPPPSQPHQFQQQYQQQPPPQSQPVHVQAPDMSGFAAAINAIPEKIVHALKEGASQFVPQPPQQPPAPPGNQSTGQQPPAAHQLPPAGQQTAVDNVERSGRGVSKFHKWWNGGV